MAKSRLIGDYPVIGIRPTIDGRQGSLHVRESLEEQTMNMAKSAAKLFTENLRYSNGEPVKVVIADSTIGRVPEAAACADKFKKENVPRNEIIKRSNLLSRFDELSDIIIPMLYKSDDELAKKAIAILKKRGRRNTYDELEEIVNIYDGGNV